MYYEYTVTVPPSTPADDPYARRLRVVKGEIVRMAVEFPRGCAGLVGARLFHGAFQVFPINPDEWAVSDGLEVISTTTYPLDQEPYELTVHSYSEDDYFDHGLKVRVDIEQVTEPELEERLARLLAAGVEYRAAAEETV